MPRIDTYEPNVGGLQPTERGTDARVQAARRIGTFYNQGAGAINSGAEAKASAANDVARSATGVANAVEQAALQTEDFMGHKEISAGAAASAKLFSDLSDKWDKTVKNADPNDPSVAAKFREEVLEPSLQNFNEAYSSTDLGRKWSEQHVESMRNQFFQKTAADMSTLAGDAVAVNVKQLGNQASNSARKSPDAHTVDYLLDKTDADVAAIVSSSPNLKGAAAAKARMQLTDEIKSQIVKSGAIGAMEKASDPEAVAADYAKRYPQYISGQEIDQFAKIAKYYKNVATSESRAARVQNDYLSKQDFNTKVNKLEADTMPQNAGDPPVMPKDYWQRLRDLSVHPGAALEPGRLKTMVQNGEAITNHLNKPEPMGRISHDTTMGIIGDIRSGKITDTGPIYEMYGQGKLNRADFNFAVNEVRNLKTPEGAALGDDRKDFFKRYAASVDGAMDFGGHSALGSQKLYQFEMEARRQELDLRKKGLDPHALYDPASEYFLGKQVGKYHISMQEGMDYQKSVEREKRAQAQPATEKPGEPAFVPPGNWDWSASRRQYRDPDGRIYDARGKRVTP